MAKYKPDIVLVEEKASGIPILQTLRRTDINLVAWRPDKYGDKVERVRKVTHLIEAGRIYVPYKGPDFRSPMMYAQLLIEMAAVFPKGESRDMVDTLSMVLQRIINSGWILHPAEQQQETEEMWRREMQGKEEVALY